MSNIVKFSLVAVLSLGLMPNSTFAQEAAADDDVEEVIITGSKIKRSVFNSSKPLEIITDAAIERTGLNNIGDVLQTISSSDGTGIRPVTTATNGGDGSNEISLRNLGAGRTLVLIDGRRWVTDAFGNVDMQTIPSSIIQRVEILKDGASSIYGSDAVAGVINIITKKDFDGFELRASSGEYDAGYGAQNQISMTFGSQSEKSRNIFNISFADQEAIFAGQIPRANQPYYGCTNVPNTGTGTPNSPTNLGPSPAQNSGYGNFAPATSGICGSSYPAYGRFFTVNKYLEPGKSGASIDDFIPWSNAGRYNYSPVNHVQNPVDRYGVYASSEFDISDNLMAYVQFNYTKSKRVNQLAQVPMTATTSAGPQWQLNNGRFATKGGHFNPFGVDTTFGFRAIAIGPRIYDYDYDTYGIRAGLEGSFDFGGNNYFWSAGMQLNDAAYDSKLFNFVDLNHLSNAVGDSFRDPTTNVLTCGTVDNPISGCTPFNLFGGPDLGLSAGVISQAEYDAMVGYVGYDGVASAGYDSDDYWLEISGPLFEMPYGTAFFAAGYEKRAGGYFDTPDALVSSGGSSTNYREPTRGKTSVEEFFVEVNMPLLSGVFMAQELEMTLSARTSDYTAEGLVGVAANSNNPGKPSTTEIGIRWRPIDDVLVRLTMGETFRAPTVGDLYQGGGESFPQANDPCNTDQFSGQSAATQANCLAAGVPAGGAEQPTTQIRGFVGGNPFLKPEEGENATVGIVYTPSQIENLSISVDFWEIELENIFSSIGVSTVLSRCYVESTQQDDTYCNFVTRTGSGGLQTVRTSKVNSAQNNVSGVDLVVGYSFDVENYGSFTTGFDMTYYTKDEFAQSATSTPSESFGWYDGAADFRWRANASILWDYNDFTTSLNFRFLDDNKDDCWISYYYGLDDGCSNPDEDSNYGAGGYNLMEVEYYTDLQVSYQYSDEISVFVGGRNIFGEEPPVAYDAFGQNFDYAWDIPGGAFIYGGFKISL
ncbi:TonB-dependent receptor [Gammaproteobacteria bacterium]|nr:TonB-dependent receptor [Gammaproteobacteria bacterium]MDB9900720.1 TonB-dependent receptor [Gammaproteobacteria bacterium]MDC0122969.1 TonB-dependent receptor [Gammaproteobacteria bacterium]